MQIAHLKIKTSGPHPDLLVPTQISNQRESKLKTDFKPNCHLYQLNQNKNE